MNEYEEDEALDGWLAAVVGADLLITILYGAAHQGAPLMLNDNDSARL